jgi:hypothetical protein
MKDNPDMIELGKRHYGRYPRPKPPMPLPGPVDEEDEGFSLPEVKVLLGILFVFVVGVVGSAIFYLVH